MHHMLHVGGKPIYRKYCRTIFNNKILPELHAALTDNIAYILLLFVLNDFIKKRLTTKSSELFID